MDIGRLVPQRHQQYANHLSRRPRCLFASEPQPALENSEAEREDKIQRQTNTFIAAAEEGDGNKGSELV
jgi:hypothetical protein